MENKDLNCRAKLQDFDKVQMLRMQKPGDFELERVSNLFRALGDRNRVLILYLLSKENLCVCDLANLIGLSESATSHHLRILRNLRLVRFQKEGKLVRYQLDDHHVRQLVKMSLDHVGEE